MQFEAEVMSFVKPPKKLRLSQPWAIRDDELNQLARAHLATLETNTDCQASANRAAWIAQALIEFQDLQDMPIPRNGPFPNNSNYLFFEAISSLRESTLAGLSGLIHTSLSGLRSALEMIVFYVWWQKKLVDDKNWSNFQQWVRGEWSSPPVKNVLGSVFDAYAFPQGAPTLQEVTRVYSGLCSYSHKPTPNQSITAMKESNAVRSLAVELLLWWLGAVLAVSNIALHFLIAAKPMSLFPVVASEKFGFNPPIGIFFDKANFLALERAVGTYETVRYRDFYRKNIEDLLDWFNGRPDLSESEILDSWSDDNEGERGVSGSDLILLRWTKLKAKCRVISWAFAYRNYEIEPPISSSGVSVR